MGADDVTGEPPTLHGVRLSSLDTTILDGDPTTKRQLIGYLEAITDRFLPELADRPLSVIRVPRNGEPFMQKNLPAHAPAFVRRQRFWADASHRWVDHGICDSIETLIWFGNQRAVEFHPALVTATRPDHMSHLVLDIDPPPGDNFGVAVQAALLVKDVLDGIGMSGVVKTSGAKGLHVLIPVSDDVTLADATGTTRAIAQRAAALDPALATVAFKKAERHGGVFIDATRFGSATVVAAFSPRARPGLPVSFPVDWDDITDVHPLDFTIHNVPDLAVTPACWLDSSRGGQDVPVDILSEARELVTSPVHGMRPYEP